MILDAPPPMTPARPPPAPLLARMWPAGFRPGRAYAIVVVVSTFVVTTWFRAGTFIATGDMGPFLRQGWEPGALWSWNYQITGAGSATNTIARAPEFLLIRLTALVGLDETVAQWLFYSVIYGLVAFGVAYAAGAVVRSEWGIVVAGCFGILNGFFLTRIPNPLNIISVGSIALITGIVMRVAQGRTMPAPIAGFAFIPVAFLSFNPPMFVVAALWAGLFAPLVMLMMYGRRCLRRLLTWYLLAAPWVLLLNAWWIVPFLQAYTGGGGAQTNTSFQDPATWTWSQINNQVPNILTLSANWAWYLPQYLPFTDQLDAPGVIWMRYLLPVLVFAAPLVALPGRRRIAMVLLGLSGLSVFLAKGLIAPLAGINLFLYTHVPGFWLFREPMSKLGQLLVLSFAVLLAITVEGVVARWRRRRADATTQAAGQPGARADHRKRFSRGPRLPAVLLIATAVAVVAVLAWPYPIATGTVIPDNRPQQPSAHVRVPEYWREVAATINADPSPGKVLVLPLDDYYQMPTQWGFFGVDSIANLLIQRGVVQPKPDGYFGDVPGYAADVRAVETALVSGDLTAVPRLLDATGIDKVIVRHDLVRGVPRRTFADSGTLTAAMAATPGMTMLASGELDLWRAPTTAGEHVRAYSDTVAVGARPDAAAAVIGSVGTGAAAMALKASTKNPPYPVVDSSPQVTLDSVQWPVPAVTHGDAATTVRLLPGRYVVAQRARAAAALTPRLDRREPALVFRDPTRVTIDGQVVSRRPPLRVPVPTRDVVAVRVGTRDISLDGWGRDDLPGNAGAYAAAPVGSATPLTAFAPSAQPADPGPPSDVYDCNNYEPRPASELGLTKTTVRTPSGPAIRLTAEDHAACTKVVVRDAAPGRTYRVRLEYRPVAGKRPQICLWQVRTDGCTLSPRPTLNRGWHPWERIVTVEPDATSLVLVLHADVGQRLLGRTVTDYRGISIEALDPVLTTEIFPPEVPQREVSLTGGDTTLAVTGGPAGSVLSDFEPLQNCFRYDDQTDQQAGLTAETTGDQHNPSIVLGAREHMACLSATVPDMGQSSLYQLSLEARKVNNNRDPRFCVFLRGLDTCQRLPAPGRWSDEWTPYQTLVTPNPAAAETRLYLYALRDKEGRRPSLVEYRGMSLVPVASPSTVVLVRQPPGGPDVMAPRAVAAESRRISPAQTQVSVAGGAKVVALTQTSAPGWHLTGFGRAAPAQGWMASWAVDGQPVAGSARYLPARLSRMALYLLPVALVLAFAALATGRWWRRRGAR